MRAPASEPPFGGIHGEQEEEHEEEAPPLVPLNRRAAGIDVGAAIHVVAVPAELDAEPVRSFRSFTADLNVLADWLVGLGITTVAMESTGIYWIPVFEISRRVVSRSFS